MQTNNLYVEVSGAGLPEVDGLFIPSTAPPSLSESGIASSLGYWNGKMAWDRDELLKHSGGELPARPLTERDEILLGLKPYPDKV